MGNTDTFLYLPYIIPFVLVQLLILIAICLYYLRPKFRITEYDIKDSFLTVIPDNPFYASVVLCCLRLAFFGFFLSVVIIGMLCIFCIYSSLFNIHHRSYDIFVNCMYMLVSYFMYLCFVIMMVWQLAQITTSGITSHTGTFG